MSLDKESRYVRRYGQVAKLSLRVLKDVTEMAQANSDLVNLSNRLLMTPPFLLEQTVQRGLDPDIFWDRALEAFRLTSTWGLTIGNMNLLADACRPQIRSRTEINLNGISYPEHPSFNIIFGDLGDRAKQASQEIPNLSTDMILTYLSTDEVPLIRYRLDLIKGEAGFPFKNLVDGGVSYFLPTVLDSVQACLIYTHRAKLPVINIIVNPISGS